MHELSRRALLGTAVGAALLTKAGTTHADDADSPQPVPPRWRFCLNTSTLRGYKLPITETIRLAAEAGYEGIEPWISEVTAYRDGGGSLPDLAKKIADAGLTVEGAIGFAEWIVDDPERRRRGLETARRDMELIRAIGGERIAAPPAGATNERMTDFDAIAERFGELNRVGREAGVRPLLEVWGFSKTLARLGEVLYVAAECGDPEAGLLLDVYHVYKGGSSFAGLSTIAGTALPVLHMNDYPATPPRETITDADRVYPGRGVAPLKMILNTLAANGFRGALSLELFNPEYWKSPPEVVATTGLESMRRAVDGLGT